MDPDATWAVITDADTDPQVRRDAALDLLGWIARGGSYRRDTIVRIDACERVIIAEFEYADRLAGR